jgi:uncharacterized protein YndB with AHSA1/START domain
MTSTTSRTQTHATFVLERDYAAPVDRVWSAFADADVKKQWFGPDDIEDAEVSEDFRVGGVAINHGTMQGRRSEFRATYSDIVDRERIVYVYDMWSDGVHASTSITTIVLEPTADGTGWLLDRIRPLVEE